MGSREPAMADPLLATTIERCPAATRARSSAESTCSAPPTASGPTGANGKATLSTLSTVSLRSRVPHDIGLLEAVRPLGADRTAGLRYCPGSIAADHGGAEFGELSRVLRRCGVVSPGALVLRREAK